MARIRKGDRNPGSGPGIEVGPVLTPVVFENAVELQREFSKPRLGIAKAVPFGGARLLLTIGPEHAVWMDVDHVIRHVINCEGALVRLDPPATATDESVQVVRKVVRETMGAKRVVVVPRRRGRAVVAPNERGPLASHRAVVERLVASANVEDREALAAFCAGAMDRAGV